MSLQFVNGAFKLKGVQTVRYEVPAMPPVTKEVVVEVKPAVVEVPTAAPEPVVVEVAAAPEPEPEPEQTVVEIPVALEVEAPAEVADAPAEAGLVPEDPPA